MDTVSIVQGHMERLGDEEYVQVALQLVPHTSHAAHLARCCTSSWRLLWHDVSLWRAFCVQCFEFWRTGVSPERLSLPALDPVAAADQRALRDQSSPPHLLRGMLAARMALDWRVALCVAEPARSGLWKPRVLGEMRAAGLLGKQVI